MSKLQPVSPRWTTNVVHLHVCSHKIVNTPSLKVLTDETHHKTFFLTCHIIFSLLFLIKKKIFIVLSYHISCLQPDKCLEENIFSIRIHLLLLRYRRFEIFEAYFKLMHISPDLFHDVISFTQSNMQRNISLLAHRNYSLWNYTNINPIISSRMCIIVCKKYIINFIDLNKRKSIERLSLLIPHYLCLGDWVDIIDIKCLNRFTFAWIHSKWPICLKTD